VVGTAAAVTLFDETLAEQLQPLIEQAFADRALVHHMEHRDAIFATMEALTKGSLRVATRGADDWLVHAWLKQAILLYFSVCPVERWEAGAVAWQDKIKTQVPAGVRIVPPGMPGYVNNIGAYVDERDDGRHLGHGGLVRADRAGRSPLGRRRLGGVLEPPGRARHHRGRRVHRLARGRGGGRDRRAEAVVGAGVVSPRAPPIIDVTGDSHVELRRAASPRSVVIAGHAGEAFSRG
jgi:2,3,4,5-tetrahydropyridine-2-carboxylate N-succinyltransferase